LCLERGSWRLEAKTTIQLLLVLALLGLLGWLCLVEATKVSTVRHRIREKEEEKVRLQQENAELLAEIAEMMSVSHLMNRTLELGYIPAEGLQYLVLDYPADDVLGTGRASVLGLDETAAVALQESSNETLNVAGWWDMVISQFVAWAGTQP